MPAISGISLLQQANVETCGRNGMNGINDCQPPHVCHVEGGRGGIDNVLNAGDSFNGNEEMGAEQRIVVQLQTAWLWEVMVVPPTQLITLSQKTVKEHRYLPCRSPQWIDDNMTGGKKQVLAVMSYDVSSMYPTMIDRHNISIERSIVIVVVTI